MRTIIVIHSNALKILNVLFTERGSEKKILTFRMELISIFIFISHKKSEMYFSPCSTKLCTSENLLMYKICKQKVFL